MSQCVAQQSYDVQSMPEWRCHKVVRALKIDTVSPTLEDGSLELGFYNCHSAVYPKMLVSAEWAARHKPEPGGWYVVYADDYASYSPAKAFEDGYHEYRVEVGNKQG